MIELNFRPTRKSLNTKQEVLERGNIPDPRRSTELFTFYHGDPPLYVCRIGNCDKSYHNYYGYQGHRKYKHPETSVLRQVKLVIFEDTVCRISLYTI